MLSKLIGGRSILGILLAVAAAVPVIIFLSGWSFTQSETAKHWLTGQLSLNPTLSMVVAITSIIATAFVTRFEISRGVLTESRGSHHLLLVPLFACLSKGVESYFQIAAACIAGVSFLMLISTPPQGEKRDPIFHLGIILGIGILLEPSLWVLAILLGLVMVRVGRYAWRNWAALLLGLAFPFVMLYTVALIFNFHEGLLSSLIESLKTNFVMSIDWKLHVFPLIVLVASITGIMAKYSPLTVTGKVLLQCYGIWLLGSIVLLMVEQAAGASIIIAMSIPAAVFVARWMEYVNRKWMADLVYVGLIVFLLI